ncbi:MAG: hypothetical protein PHP98_08595 [Kiritimatiellae bacterium]|nr:hypothetical protein [Kiritimatiellia bacterium]
MNKMLHITSGDIAGSSLAQSGVPGEVFVWHDVLYDGPRNPGWPDEKTMEKRALFLEGETGGGLKREFVLDTVRKQYRRLADAKNCERIVLWFDACLFDQAMLAHILACLFHLNILRAELLCIDAFPGIVPFNGLGQLRPAQMASLYGRRRPVTDAQFRFARVVDAAFAAQNSGMLAELARRADAPLPWVPAAAARWLQEQPDARTGLGRLEQLAFDAIRGGRHNPAAILRAVAAADTIPRFWGDNMLWAKINALADRMPPMVRIEGPAEKLPQWKSALDLESFRITAAPSACGRSC